MGPAYELACSDGELYAYDVRRSAFLCWSVMRHGFTPSPDRFMNGTTLFGGEGCDLERVWLSGSFEANMGGRLILASFSLTFQCRCIRRGKS